MLRPEYVKVYRDRHGALRRYFRRRGKKDVPPDGERGTIEFKQAAAVNVSLGLTFYCCSRPRRRYPDAI
jgi:hypothetical protein